MIDQLRPGEYVVMMNYKNPYHPQQE